MKKKPETIYVVSSKDYDGSHCVIGAWRRRGKALDEAVDYVLERLALRHDIADAFADDWNHVDMVGAVRHDGKRLTFVKPERDVRAYVRDALGGDGCYYIEPVTNHWFSFRFDLDETDIED